MPEDAGAFDDAGTLDAGPFDAGCLLTDPLDELGLDTNCDGIDGVRARLLFVSPTGSDGTGVVGDLNRPFRTFGYALGLASADGGDGIVLFAGDSFVETGSSLRWTGEVVIWGGRDTLGRPTSQRTSIALGSSGLRGEDLTASATLANLNLSSAPADAGQASVVLTLERASPTLKALRLTAGTGGAGLPGLDGMGGASGGDGQPGQLRDAGAPGGLSPCGAEPGGSGGTGSLAAQPTDGGGGAAGGSETCAGPAVLQGGRGRDGGVGATGVQGPAALEAGAFVVGEWVSWFADAGTAGDWGQPGGGGGASGCVKPCDTTGGGRTRFGGGGGAGGCGGAGGRGGSGGAPSVALLVLSGRPALADVELVTSRGGAGGAGGRGGPGGGGGRGGAGEVEPLCALVSAGAGGAGGQGGAGGVGGAGRGGPSIGIWCAPDAGFDGQPAFNLGAGGLAAPGGLEGFAAERWECR